MKRNEHLEQVSLIDWARLAAFIDGEGFICPSGDSGIHVGAANTKVALMDWLKTNFGGNYGESTSKANGRRFSSYRWYVASADKKLILTKIRPYLLLKGKQAELGLAILETIKPVGYKGLTDRELMLRIALMEALSILNERGVGEPMEEK